MYRRRVHVIFEAGDLSIEQNLIMYQMYARLAKDPVYCKMQDAKEGKTCTAMPRLSPIEDQDQLYVQDRLAAM